MSSTRTMTPDALVSAAVALLPSSAAAELVRDWIMDAPRSSEEIQRAAIGFGLVQHPELALSLYDLSGQIAGHHHNNFRIGQGELLDESGNPKDASSAGDGASSDLLDQGGNPKDASAYTSQKPDPTDGADVAQNDPTMDDWELLGQDEQPQPDYSDPSLVALLQAQADSFVQRQAQGAQVPAPLDQDPYAAYGQWLDQQQSQAAPLFDPTQQFAAAPKSASFDPSMMQSAPFDPTTGAPFDPYAQQQQQGYPPGYPQQPQGYAPPPSSSPYVDPYAPPPSSSPYVDPYAPPYGAPPSSDPYASSNPYDPYAGSAPPPLPPYSDPYAAYTDPSVPGGDPYADPAPYYGAVPVPTTPTDDGSKPPLNLFQAAHALGPMKVPPGPQSYDGQWRMTNLYIMPDPAEITANGYVGEFTTTMPPDGTDGPIYPLWRIVSEDQAAADTQEYDPGDPSSITAGFRIGQFRIGQSLALPTTMLVQKKPAGAPPTAPAKALANAPRGALFAPVTRTKLLPGLIASAVKLPTGKAGVLVHAITPPISAPHMTLPTKTPSKSVAITVPKNASAFVASKLTASKLAPRLSVVARPLSTVPLNRGAASSTTTGNPYDGVWHPYAQVQPPTHPDPSYRLVHRAPPTGMIWRFIRRLPRGAKRAPFAVPRSLHLASGSTPLAAHFAPTPVRIGDAASNGSYLDGSVGSGGWPPHMNAGQIESLPTSSQDPRVVVPTSLLSGPEHIIHQQAIVGQYAVIGQSCLSSDRRSSMEDFWRRREAIIGELPEWTSAIGHAIGGVRIGDIFSDIAHSVEGIVNDLASPHGARARPMPTSSTVVAQDPTTLVVPPLPRTPPPITIITRSPAGKPLMPTSRPSGKVVSPSRTFPTPRAIPQNNTVPQGWGCTAWQSASAAPPQYAFGRPGVLVQSRQVTANGASQPQRRWCWPQPDAMPVSADQQGQAVSDAVIFQAQLEQLFGELSQLDDASRSSWLYANPRILMAMIQLGWIQAPPDLSSYENAPADAYAPSGYDAGGYPKATPGQPSSGAYAASGPSWQPTSQQANAAPPQLPGCGPWRPVDTVAPPAGMKWIFSDDHAWMCLSGSNASVGQIKRRALREAAKAKDHAPSAGPWVTPAQLEARIGQVPPGHYWQRRYENGQIAAARVVPKRTTVAGLSCCANCAARDAGAIRVGDVWGDIGHAVANADQWITTNVWSNVKDVVPYGQQIDAANNARLNLLRQAAPDFYGQPTSATDDAIRAAQTLSRGVRRGDAASKDAAVQLKEHAAAGDPAARRAWYAYVQVAQDDDRRIEGTTTS